MSADLGAARTALSHGDLDRAQVLLERLLAQNPDDADVLERLAIVHCRRGALACGEALLERALSIQPEHAAALNSLGAVLQNQNRLEQARSVLERAVTLQPDAAGSWCNLGIVLQGLQRPGPAQEALARALQLQPGHLLALRASVHGLRIQGRAIEAITLLRDAASHDPSRWDELVDLGNTLYQQGQYRSAAKAYETTLAGCGESAELHANLGAAQLALHQPRLALASVERALQLRPAYPEALANLSEALRLLDRPAEALLPCDQALALRPDFAAAHIARGQALRDLLQPEQALAALASAHALQPDDLDLRGDLALSFQECGLLVEALERFEAALAAQPGNADIRTNRGICRLLASDQRQGWDDYEARFQRRQPVVPQVRPASPRWRGGAVSAGPLLLVGEQGLGDMLQFSRYAPSLRAVAGSVALCLSEPLVDLVAAAGIADAVWTPEQAAQHRGPWLPLLSVFQALGQSPDALAAAVPYLQVPAARIEHWRQRIQRGPGPLIGLNWQGNPEAELGSGRGRSLPLASLEPLSHLSQLQFLSLQKGPGAEQLASCSFRERFCVGQEQVEAAWSFLDTAAIICACDLIISSDSVVAHLAGALGRPVWLLLKWVPDWRWGLEGDSSHWYPSMRLFRQRQGGDWSEPIERLAAELALEVPRLIAARSD
ncbi:MAG: tetratricopeptide repeat protein [Cyanobium sp.]